MLDREAAIAWYRRNRERSRALFDMVAERDEVYYGRPISLRHPIVFYEGHLPGFSFNTLVRKALGGPSIDARLEGLFARGIDPHESQSQGPGGSWPTREEAHAFAAEADRRVLDALCREDLDRPGHPLLDRAEAVFTILEHEAMHHETLLYMWHRLALEDKRRPTDYAPRIGDGAPRQEWVEVPGGSVTLGIDRAAAAFGWDNEFPRHSAVVEPFAIERFNVTNAQFLEFVETGGYRDARWWRAADWNWVQSEAVSHPSFWERQGDAWYWRGMFDRLPLPLAWPVYVSYAEADAYTRWRADRTGEPVRLPTEAEFQRAAFGVPGAAAALGAPFGAPGADGERPHPWGTDAPADARGVFDFSSWDPHPVGTHPAGQSAWGVDELVGNGWEWTSTAFAPFPGFRAMTSYPEYSADFFDGDHMVLKGASPATAAEFLRPTFRNWFRPRYPYVYATFRSVTKRPGRR